MGASSIRSSKVQLEQGTKSGATSLAQLFPSHSFTGASLCLTYHQCIL